MSEAIIYNERTVYGMKEIGERIGKNAASMIWYFKSLCKTNPDLFVPEEDYFEIMDQDRDVLRRANPGKHLGRLTHVLTETGVQKVMELNKPAAEVKVLKPITHNPLKRTVITEPTPSVEEKHEPTVDDNIRLMRLMVDTMEKMNNESKQKDETIQRLEQKIHLLEKSVKIVSAYHSIDSNVTRKMVLDAAKAYAISKGEDVGKVMSMIYHHVARKYGFDLKAAMSEQGEKIAINFMVKNGYIQDCLDFLISGFYDINFGEKV